MTDFILVHIDCVGTAEGTISIDPTDDQTAIWTRLKLVAANRGLLHTTQGHSLKLSWPDTLSIIRELGSKQSQRELGFRFKATDEAKRRIVDFSAEVKRVQVGQQDDIPSVSEADIERDLVARGFTKRELKKFQLRDLSRLMSLPNGANFSVPGAGKTTVTFALNLLTKKPDERLLVVAPKAANQAWKDVVRDTMEDGAPDNGSEPFVVLDGSEFDTEAAINSSASRFIISYDLMIRQQNVLERFLASTPVHLVLDESHRMKAGWYSQRGAFLLRVACLPVRRDILSGTPMPQSAADIQSQLDFLWPGHGLGTNISLGMSPRKVLGSLYVRTTKTELGLPPVNRHFIDIDMLPGQLALYSIVRNELLRDFTRKLKGRFDDQGLIRARRSVMRLLQLSSNPMLALNAMLADGLPIDSAIVEQVLEEGDSGKMLAVANHARSLADKGEKTVIWTIFTKTIDALMEELAALNPVCIHGSVPSGDEDDAHTREGKIKRFHEDKACSVIIANPAAAGEGISLHTVCHKAIYLDRSYVSTHYLQSIDRIHRLGLEKDQETDIYVYRTKAPAQIGSIDLSVSRRLVLKVQNMQELLDDPDLKQIYLDEEKADDPIDYDFDLEDIIDLIRELEGKSKSSSSDHPLL